MRASDRCSSDIRPAQRSEGRTVLGALEHRRAVKLNLTGTAFRILAYSTISRGSAVYQLPSWHPQPCATNSVAMTADADRLARTLPSALEIAFTASDQS